MTGPVPTGTYGYAGGEIDLLGRDLVPAGRLSGLKARILLGLALRGDRGVDAAREAFRCYA
jgi:L-asparaginase